MRLSCAVLTLFASPVLTACTQVSHSTEPLMAPASSITPSAFRLPDGAGCSGEIARYRAVMENDLATGHVSRSVYERVMGEIDRAAAACTAGRDGDAHRMIAATKARYGYR